MQHQLYGLRGATYVKTRKRLFEELKDQIVVDCYQIQREKGSFKIKDIGILCNKYLIPVTVMVDWLYDLGICPYRHEKLKDRGLKAKDLGVVWS